MKDEITKIKFIEYNGIEGYIELMKHDIEPLNDPECRRLELCYNGKDIKAVLDYITNLQEENKKLDSQNTINRLYWKKLEERNEKAIEFIDKYCIDDEFYINLSYKEKAIIKVKKILQGSDK